jgi:hypothetical protein
MENKEFVLGILEAVLGKGDRSKSDNVEFNCPICGHHKKKLVVNISTGKYNCWTCFPKTSGGNPVSLLKKINASKEAITEMRGYFKDYHHSEELQEDIVVTLPKEYIQLSNADETKLEIRRAIAYLDRRGIGKHDIMKYGIGYCENGKYRGRIIVPSYNSVCSLNYFIARAISEGTRKYDAPICKKSEVVGFENLINWNTPVILCEGAFDAIALKRNAIPLFGKTIPLAVMKRLISNDVKTIYLALDRDALKEASASAEELMKYGKEVYLIDLEKGDPSEIGFKEITTLLHTAKPLTFETLFGLKMKTVFK